MKHAYLFAPIFAMLVVIDLKSLSTHSLVVNITQGPVRGYKNDNWGLFTFYNIPYATVPTGSARFKAPLSPPTWSQPFEAVDRGIACLQPGFFNVDGTLDIREDCLVVNIFVPDTNDTNISVLVAVHGGAFQVGYGNYIELMNFVQTQKIIVVTFNYRLGAHGFLCLGTEAVPGNAGMKDQVALLRWVNVNIANFGGNPIDVTIVGCSAGGSSVHMLTLSKMSRGLFNKAIPESGVSIGGSGVQVDPVDNAKIYARLLNFTNVEDTSALEEFYKTASFEFLMSANQASSSRKDSFLLFAPCVERDTGTERFLDETPHNIIKSGEHSKVPLLYGFTNMEGMIRLPNFYTWKDEMNEKFADFLPRDLHFKSDEEREEVAALVKSFYFGNMSVSEDTILSYIDFFSDVMFVYPMLNMLKWHTESGNDTIYLYEYSFVDENTPFVPYTEVRGAVHCRQATDYYFESDESNNITAEQKNITTTLRELWMNFILNGNPVLPGGPLPAWPPANVDRSPYMSLGRTIELKASPLEQRVDFWDGLYQRYFQDAIPPSIPDSATRNTVALLWITFIVLIY